VSLALVAWGVVAFVRRDRTIDEPAAEGDAATVERGPDATDT